MPYKLVLTKNGLGEEVTTVPEGWVVGGYLYWPRLLKKSDIESLRTNEMSIPDKSWKKIKCRVKLDNISSFEEALRLEELYSKFQDTEDEEIYLNERQNKRKQTCNLLSKELLDVNLEFQMNEKNQNEICPDKVSVQSDENITKNVANVDEIDLQVLNRDKQDNIQVTLNDVEDTSSDNIVTLKTSELLKVIQENQSLHIENKTLKEELLRSTEFQNETKKNFAIMQIQLDKIIELLQNNSQASTSIHANDDPSTSENGFSDIILDNIKFPIETKEQLDALEYKLLEKDAMIYLIRKLSETCGTSGVAKISKIGLPLMKRLIKDELLNQFTWKGIKGTTKLAFLQYVKIRELFYKVAHLADKSCSFSDTDSFLQNSAIKHSGQRLKRQILASDSKLNVKKKKLEINVNEKESIQVMIPTAEQNYEIEMDQKKRNIQKHHELTNNEKENCSDINDDNKDLNTEKYQNCGNINTELSSLKSEKQGLNIKSKTDDLHKITILSDVKIHNKAVDNTNILKQSNISAVNVGSVFDELINFSP